MQAGIGATLLRLGLVLGLACVVTACDDDEKPPAAPAAKPAVDRRAADLAHGITTELDTATTAFGDGVLAELMGDAPAARVAFERVLAATDSPPSVAARAALHLAQIVSREGKSRDAQELVARATALAPNDPTISDGVDQLRADLVAAAGASDIRGPRLGTALPGVPADIADAFSASEKTLGKVSKLRLKPVIEAWAISIRMKEDATETLAARYRAIADKDERAALAARYRAGGLYHDLAIALLVVDLPPELDRKEQIRRTLRGRALTYLKRAVVEYRAALAGPMAQELELWRLAAETDLRRALDVVGEAAGGK